MPSFRSPATQAVHATRQKRAHGVPRHDNKRDSKIHSLGTERNYRQSLKNCTEFLILKRLGGLADLTVQKANVYLEKRSTEVGQVQLDLDRQALSMVLGQPLVFIKSMLPRQGIESRAYTPEQVSLIFATQNESHALATKLADGAGLRAHELLTLRRASEQHADTHREFRLDRFIGMPKFALYTVIGKGGLCREVAIGSDLVLLLEQRRLAMPRTVYDREIKYRQFYDIGGGKRWSDSFYRASRRALGWSQGSHGLRHGYVQQRVDTLQGLGYIYDDALEVVSQEIGHFRAYITQDYLR